MKKAVVVVVTVAVLGVVALQTSTPAQPHLIFSKSSAQQGSPSSSAPTTYKDGTYKGGAEYNPFGTVQIAVIINGGKISDVNFLQMPNDVAHSQEVTAFAEPLLKQVTLKAQSANIDFVSGATTTSISYQASLQSALDKAAQSSSSSTATTNSTVSPAPTQNPYGGGYGQ